MAWDGFALGIMTRSGSTRSSSALGSYWNLTLNLVSAVLIFYVSFSFARRYLRSSSNPVIGRPLAIKDVNWRRAPHTLVLALSTNCPFCDESTTFYRDLLNHNQTRSWQAIAVFREPVALSKMYTQSQGYDISDTRQEDLRALGVSGTPTLFLVDPEGDIEDEWIGELDSAQQHDVASHLGVKLLP